MVTTAGRGVAGLSIRSQVGGPMGRLGGIPHEAEEG
jgi:hypothetical protein